MHTKNLMTVRTLVSTALLIALNLSCAHAGTAQHESEIVSGVVRGAWSPANPDPSPALPRGMYEGEYIDGFEVSAFIACGSRDRWWTEGELSPIVDFEKAHPDKSTPSGWYASRLYLRVLATPTATGNYGHLGSYPRRLDVHEVLEVREWKDTDCQGTHGA